MMYELDDPYEEVDHVMPWRQVLVALLFSLAVLVLLSLPLAVLWLFSKPKDGGEAGAVPPLVGAPS